MEPFFFRSPEESVKQVITARQNNWSPTLRACVATIAVGSKTYFPHTDQSYQLRGVSIEESGDYMTARRCEISIWCPDYDSFLLLEPDFCTINVNKTLSIQFKWSPSVATAEESSVWYFKVFEPSFTFNKDGSIEIKVKGIGAGTELLNINMFDIPFTKALPGYMFVSDYGGVGGAQTYSYVETLVDYIDWLVQDGTKTGLSDTFEPGDGSSAVNVDGGSSRCGWLIKVIDDDMYSNKHVSYQDSMLVDTYALPYITLELLVHVINKYYTTVTDKNGKKPPAMEIICNDEVTTGNLSYKTSDGSSAYIFSADPLTLILPYGSTEAQMNYVIKVPADANGQTPQFPDKIQFDLTSLTAAAGLFDACSMASGALGGMLINRDLIKAIYTNSTESVKSTTADKKDTSVLSLNTFFGQLFNSIKELTGGAIDLALQMNPQKTTKDKTIYEVRNKHEVPKSITVDPLKVGPRDGTTLELSLAAKVPQSMQAAAFGAAQSTNGDATSTVVSHGDDNVDAKKEPTGKPAAEEIEKVKSKLISNSFSQESITAAKGILKRLVSEQSAVEKAKHTTDMFPIEMSLKLLGFDGLRFGDTITSDRLPKRYRTDAGGAKIGFTIHEIRHVMDGATQPVWTTEVKTVCRIIDSANIK
jgi:hypothetical protein